MNTFGTPTVQFPLVDPRCVREHRARFRRDLFSELDRANSYYSMAGRWPDVGWLLVDRASYDRICSASASGAYVSNLQLTMCDFVNPKVVVSDLSIVQARCVTRGLAADPSAIYLLQVTNRQGVLYNPWFQAPISAQYNVRAPAYDGSYYYGSLTGANNTDAWTWDEMVGDMWAQAGGLLGTYPGLPVAPIGAPEGWVFAGVPLWPAVGRTLDYLGLAVSGAYPSYSIVILGAPDAAYTALQAKYVPYLEDSMEYVEGGSGRAPSQVIVYFHRRNAVYGTEETVTYNSFQWQNTPLYSVTIPAPAQFTNSLGVGYLWADYTVRHDQNGNPLATDVTAAHAIAVERVRQYFNVIYRGTAGFMRDTYSGVLPFATGSLVDGVRWFNTGILEGRDDRYAGWRTEVVRGYVWPEVVFPPQVESFPMQDG